MGKNNAGLVLKTLSVRKININCNGKNELLERKQMKNRK
jgi:hypothetical protein